MIYNFSLEKDDIFTVKETEEYIIEFEICSEPEYLSSGRKKWEMIYLEINYLLYLNRRYLGRLNEIINMILYAYHLPLIKQYAINFMQDYDEVYTTRLHGGILAMMLGKKVRLVDNNYGKISALYKTWLLNETNIEMID